VYRPVGGSSGGIIASERIVALVHSNLPGEVLGGEAHLPLFATNATFRSVLATLGHSVCLATLPVGARGELAGLFLALAWQNLVLDELATVVRVSLPLLLLGPDGLVDTWVGDEGVEQVDLNRSGTFAPAQFDLIADGRRLSLTRGHTCGASRRTRCECCSAHKSSWDLLVVIQWLPTIASGWKQTNARNLSDTRLLPSSSYYNLKVRASESELTLGTSYNSSKH
jgi:hypothetical protein